MMKWKIGFRTIKTAIGTGLAVACAQLLDLEFYISAGAMVIFCVQTSRKKSYQAAWERFLACSIVLLISAGLFSILGFHPWTLTLVLLLAIPIQVNLKLHECIAMSTLLMFHLYVVKDISTSFFFNELSILSIGILFGLFVNLYMPHSYKKLTHLQEQIESNFKKILHEMAVYLRRGESDWNGAEILETYNLIKQAQEISLNSLENNPEEKEKYFYRYFRMRRCQFHILELMMPMVSRLPQTVSQGNRIADFLDYIADHIHLRNMADIRLEELNRLIREFKEQPLPKDREEFETRATLLQLVYEIERYLISKKYLEGKEDPSLELFFRRIMPTEDMSKVA